MTTLDESIHCLAAPLLQRLFQEEKSTEMDVSSNNQYPAMGSKNWATVLLYCRLRAGPPGEDPEKASMLRG